MVRSSASVAICRATNAGGTAWTPVTPRVLWAVSAVSTAGAIDAERREGLEVGLDAGPAGGVRPGNGQRDGYVAWPASVPS